MCIAVRNETDCLPLEARTTIIHFQKEQTSTNLSHTLHSRLPNHNHDPPFAFVDHSFKATKPPSRWLRLCSTCESNRLLGCVHMCDADGRCCLFSGKGALRVAKNYTKGYSDTQVSSPQSVETRPRYSRWCHVFRPSYVMLRLTIPGDHQEPR